MTEILEKPLFGLDESFPDKLYIFKAIGMEKYICYCHNGIHGLSCFENKENADKFSDLCNVKVQLMNVEFDEAREIAKERPLPVVCLLLLDHIYDPKIHYVK